MPLSCFPLSKEGECGIAEERGEVRLVAINQGFGTGRLTGQEE